MARQILRNWLSQYNKYYKLYTCSLGAEEYLELIRVKLPTILDSIIILDGDKNIQKINNRIVQYEATNVLFLPSNDCPEKMFYNFLYNLSEDDKFWDLTLGGFDKTKCFLEYATLHENNADTSLYKKWFESVKSNFGKGYSKLLNYWKVIETEEYKSFIQAFINSYNTIANKLHYDTIDDL